MYNRRQDKLKHDRRQLRRQKGGYGDGGKKVATATAMAAKKAAMAMAAKKVATATAAKKAAMAMAPIKNKYDDR